MGLEIINCCGAFIHVYGDNGKYKHESFCDGVPKTAAELARFRLEHFAVPPDVTFDNPITGKKIGRRTKNSPKEPI